MRGGLARGYGFDVTPMERATTGITEAGRGMSLPGMGSPMWSWALGWLAAGGMALGAASGASDKVIPPEPTLPSLKSIRLEPASVVLEDARDARRVLVLGERTDGGVVDLTGVAKWKVSGDEIGRAHV